MPTVLLRDMALEMLVTQLIAAKVYTAFLRWGGPAERTLWSTLLQHEFEHAAYLARIQGVLPDRAVESREVRLAPFRQVGELALRRGELSAVQRVALALRLEHAELDHGLEGLVFGEASDESLHVFGEKPPFHGDWRGHYRLLIQAASPYRAAPEVEGQLRRLLEHFPELADDAGEEDAGTPLPPESTGTPETPGREKEKQ